jgi:hypothetical protein
MLWAAVKIRLLEMSTPLPTYYCFCLLREVIATIERWITEFNYALLIGKTKYKGVYKFTHIQKRKMII